MAITEALPNPGAGRLLSLIRDGDAVTRADLVRHTGMARSTVAQRVEALLAHRLVYEAGESASTGGRPPTVLAFNESAGVVLVADLGATHARVAMSDLAGTPLVEESHDLDITDGPERVLSWLDNRFVGLLQAFGRSGHEVRGIGLGVPGPVAFDTGRPVSPPIMPGWDGFSIPNWFADRYDAPVLVDNDVNIMAIGEHWMHWRDCEQMLYVKVGTGIGCGIISARGAVHRGAQGAAGDIGHIRVPGHGHVLCRCGNAGCLEAVAGGRALAERLLVDPTHDSGTRDVLRLVRAGDPEATQAVREAGRCLGDVLASCVNLFNPSVIVIGGDLAQTEQLLAGVREIAFRRSLPLATRDLRLVASRLGDRAGVIGTTIMVTEHVLAPAAVDQLTRPHAQHPGNGVSKSRG
ncbi:MAG: ROK family transcriptional regulator [Thermoleophilaceae bacterium]